MQFLFFFTVAVTSPQLPSTYLFQMIVTITLNCQVSTMIETASKVKIGHLKSSLILVSTEDLLKEKAIAILAIS